MQSTRQTTGNSWATQELQKQIEAQTQAYSFKQAFEEDKVSLTDKPTANQQLEKEDVSHQKKQELFQNYANRYKPTGLSNQIPVSKELHYEVTQERTGEAFSRFRNKIISRQNQDTRDDEPQIQLPQVQIRPSVTDYKRIVLSRQDKVMEKREQLLDNLRSRNEIRTKVTDVSNEVKNTRASVILQKSQDFIENIKKTRDALVEKSSTDTESTLLTKEVNVNILDSVIEGLTSDNNSYLNEILDMTNSLIAIDNAINQIEGARSDVEYKLEQQKAERLYLQDNFYAAEAELLLVAEGDVQRARKEAGESQRRMDLSLKEIENTTKELADLTHQIEVYNNEKKLVSLASQAMAFTGAENMATKATRLEEIYRRRELDKLYNQKKSARTSAETVALDVNIQLLRDARMSVITSQAEFTYFSSVLENMSLKVKKLETYSDDLLRQLQDQAKTTKQMQKSISSKDSKIVNLQNEMNVLRQNVATMNSKTVASQATAAAATAALVREKNQLQENLTRVTAEKDALLLNNGGVNEQVRLLETELTHKNNFIQRFQQGINALGAIQDPQESIDYIAQLGTALSADADQSVRNMGNHLVNLGTRLQVSQQNALQEFQDLLETEKREKEELARKYEELQRTNSSGDEQILQLRDQLARNAVELVRSAQGWKELSDMLTEEQLEHVYQITGHVKIEQLEAEITRLRKEGVQSTNKTIEELEKKLEAAEQEKKKAIDTHNLYNTTVVTALRRAGVDKVTDKDVIQSIIILGAKYAALGNAVGKVFGLKVSGLTDKQLVEELQGLKDAITREEAARFTKNLKSVQDSSNKRVSELMGQLTVAGATIASLREQVKTVVKDKNDMSETWRKSDKNVEDRIEWLVRTKESLEREYNESQEQVMALQKVLAGSVLEIHGLTLRIEKLENENKKLLEDTAGSDKLVKRNKELSTALTEKESHIGEVEGKLGKQKTNRKNLKARVKELEGEIDLLTRKLKVAKVSANASDDIEKLGQIKEGGNVTLGKGMFELKHEVKLDDGGIVQEDSKILTRHYKLDMTSLISSMKNMGIIDFRHKVKANAKLTEQQKKSLSIQVANTMISHFDLEDNRPELLKGYKWENGKEVASQFTGSAKRDLTLIRLKAVGDVVHSILHDPAKFAENVQNINTNDNPLLKYFNLKKTYGVTLAKPKGVILPKSTNDFSNFYEVYTDVTKANLNGITLMRSIFSQDNVYTKLSTFEEPPSFQGKK